MLVLACNNRNWVFFMVFSFFHGLIRGHANHYRFGRNQAIASGEILLRLSEQNRVCSISSIKNSPFNIHKGSKFFAQVRAADQNLLASSLNQLRRSADTDAAGGGSGQVHRLHMTLLSKEGDEIPYWVDLALAKNNQVDVHLIPASAVVMPGDEISIDDNLFIQDGQARRQLADLSHEMKTPLTAILGFTDAMREETFGPLGHEKYAEYADHIHSSGRHLMGLVTSVLDLQRLENQPTPLRYAPGNVVELTRECVEILRLQWEGAGLVVSLKCTSDIPDSVFDPQLVRQIVMNLLSNAIKFTKEGVIRILISCDQTRLTIAIQDKGIGMGATQMHALGERHTKAQSDGVRGARGHGLGLALAAALASHHGGNLVIDSAPGEGATATFQLPFIAVGEVVAANINAGTDEDGYQKPLHVVRDGEYEIYQTGRTEALQTQLERIDDYRRRAEQNSGVTAA